MTKSKQPETNTSDLDTSEEMETAASAPDQETQQEWDETQVDPEGEEDLLSDDPLTVALAQAQARVAELEAEQKEMQDRALRAVAEGENTRRRLEQERQKLARYGAEGLAKDLLSVADNLRRALDAVPQEVVEENEALKNLLVGVEMTEKELAKAMEKHGVQVLDPMGQPFDPNHHQAMFEAPSEEHEPGTVSQVVARGYILHDRLLRPAMVGVVKKG